MNNGCFSSLIFVQYCLFVVFLLLFFFFFGGGGGGGGSDERRRANRRTDRPFPVTCNVCLILAESKYTYFAKCRF